MKKILLLMALVSFTFSNAQTTMSHSTDQTIANGLVACGSNTDGYTSENSYWRTYIPANYGLTGTIDLQSVDFALSFVDNGGADPSLDINVRLYTTDAAFPGGNRTEISSKTIQVSAADNLTLITATFDTPAQVDANDEVVVEINMTDGQPNTVDFRIAGNNLGEDAEGYISAVECGLGNPVTYTSISFPDSHMIVNLIAQEATGSLANDNFLSSSVSIFPNVATDNFTIKNTSNIALTSVSLFDINGRVVSNTNLNNLIGEKSINVSNLSAGMYFVEINSADAKITRKLIKK